ncbi:MAG: hypothetical protein ABI877_03010 [Gemmatimonadaceae bacterium]
MNISITGRVVSAVSASIMLLSAFQQARKPEEEFVGIIKAYLGMSLPTDWEGIEKLPNLRWAQLPPTSLQNCLPDGGCFTRQGTATIGGRNLVVVATGARTMVSHIYFRNGAAPLGESAVVAALKLAAISAELARCPIRSGAGGTNWYRLSGANLAPASLSIQPPATGRPTEGFVLSHGEELPPLQPNQLALYSEKCSAGAERKAVSNIKPHEQLAQSIVSLLVPATGPALYDWKALTGLPTEIAWDPAGPKPVDLSFKNDRNPVSQTGSVTYAGRTFSLLASGTPTQVKTIYFDEGGMHPRGEHMLGVVYERGIVVQLVRCGPVYTESTNNWYSLTSPRTRTAMVRQSIRYEGNQVQDSYELRTDGTLPARDPRDRNPGVNGC